eukprot:SAG31_NODE_2020_length_6659_cov_1.685976_1_plen_378_part_10
MAQTAMLRCHPTGPANLDAEALNGAFSALSKFCVSNSNSASGSSQASSSGSIAGTGTGMDGAFIVGACTSPSSSDAIGRVYTDTSRTLAPAMVVKFVMPSIKSCRDIGSYCCGGGNGGGITGGTRGENAIGRTRPVIANNIIRRCYHGIGFEDGAHPLLLHNLILDCFVGITLYSERSDNAGLATTAGNIVWHGDGPVTNSHLRSSEQNHRRSVVTGSSWWPGYLQSSGAAYGQVYVSNSIIRDVEDLNQDGVTENDTWSHWSVLDAILSPEMSTGASLPQNTDRNPSLSICLCPGANSSVSAISVTARANSNFNVAAMQWAPAADVATIRKLVALDFTGARRGEQITVGPLSADRAVPTCSTSVAALHPILCGHAAD